ncbi:UNVERIFIED_CONTAM: hypothetical protein K2H54_024514 [Gekko kuhli]
MEAQFHSLFSPAVAGNAAPQHEEKVRELLQGMCVRGGGGGGWVRKNHIPSCTCVSVPQNLTLKIVGHYLEICGVYFKFFERCCILLKLLSVTFLDVTNTRKGPVVWLVSSV